MPSLIDYSGEGRLDATLARRLIIHAKAEPGIDYIERRGPHGKDALDRQLPGLAIAARYGRRILVLRDLDSDACGGALARSLLPGPAGGLCLRIAVRASEAWLLGDNVGIAAALGVTVATVPRAPETIPNPKDLLATLGRRSSRRSVRDIFAGSQQQRNGWVADFIRNDWNIDLAATAAPSLHSALRRLGELADQ